uniref:Uncharacterized protein n=1 Tax=Glossina brevipalpis TaxID=37001 RepID=A0A1A9W6D3_9MUSC
MLCASLPLPATSSPFFKHYHACESKKCFKNEKRFHTTFFAGLILNRLKMTTKKKTADAVNTIGNNRKTNNKESEKSKTKLRHHDFNHFLRGGRTKRHPEKQKETRTTTTTTTRTTTTTQHNFEN